MRIIVLFAGMVALSSFVALAGCSAEPDEPAILGRKEALQGKVPGGGRERDQATPIYRGPALEWRLNPWSSGEAYCVAQPGEPCAVWQEWPYPPPSPNPPLRRPYFECFPDCRPVHCGSNRIAVPPQHYDACGEVVWVCGRNSKVRAEVSDVEINWAITDTMWRSLGGPDHISVYALDPCGDHFCDAGCGENPFTCPEDCQAPPDCTPCEFVNCGYDLECGNSFCGECRLGVCQEGHCVQTCGDGDCSTDEFLDRDCCNDCPDQCDEGYECDRGTGLCSMVDVEECGDDQCGPAEQQYGVCCFECPCRPDQTCNQATGRCEASGCCDCNQDGTTTEIECRRCGGTWLNVDGLWLCRPPNVTPAGDGDPASCGCSACGDETCSDDERMQGRCCDDCGCPDGDSCSLETHRCTPGDCLPCETVQCGLDTTCGGADCGPCPPGKTCDRGQCIAEDFEFCGNDRCSLNERLARTCCADCQDCPPGYRCDGNSCVYVGSSEEYCNDGECGPNERAYQTCCTDCDDCPSGTYCIQNICQAPAAGCEGCDADRNCQVTRGECEGACRGTVSSGVCLTNCPALCATSSSLTLVCHEPCPSGLHCEGGECVADPADCGDDDCTPYAEDCGVCPEDCPCDPGYHCQNHQCVEDSPEPFCGDDDCTPYEEDCGVCPEDCPCDPGYHCLSRQCVEDSVEPFCGDDDCGGGEDICSCPEDCPGTCNSCGDGSCDGGEDCYSCWDDCAAFCSP